MNPNNYYNQYHDALRAKYDAFGPAEVHAVSGLVHLRNK